MFFSANTRDDVKQSIMSYFDVYSIIDTKKYLDLSSLIGKKKKVIFGFLKDRLYKRINH